MSNQKVVELLKMYNKPEIWEDNSIYEEIEIVLDKIQTPGFQFADRERFILSELTKGLLAVVESTLDNITDQGEKAALLITVVDILSFLQLLGER